MAQPDDVDKVSGLQAWEADLNAAFRSARNDDDPAPPHLSRVDDDARPVPFGNHSRDAADVRPHPLRHPAPRWVESHHNPVSGPEGDRVHLAALPPPPPRPHVHPPPPPLPPHRTTL